MLSIVIQAGRNHYEGWGKEAKSQGSPPREAFSSCEMHIMSLGKGLLPGRFPWWNPTKKWNPEGLGVENVETRMSSCQA